MNVDDEWLAFLEDDIDGTILSSPKQNNTVKKNITPNNDMACEIDNRDNTMNKQKSISVVPSELYISTKTKIIYLNQKIDLNETFWKIPVMHYGTRSNCVIKKQIKLQSFSNEELCKILHYVSQHQMQGYLLNN